MQAIITKYHGPTNSRSARIKASAQRGSCFVSWDYALEPERNHALAACALVKKFADEDAKRYGSNEQTNPWLRPFVSGVLLDGSHAHVFTE